MPSSSTPPLRYGGYTTRIQIHFFQFEIRIRFDRATTIRRRYDRVCELLHCGLDKQAVREAATMCSRPLQVDLQPFELESGVNLQGAGAHSGGLPQV